LSPFWRREKPLHERLAEKGGMVTPTEAGRDVAPWHQAGVHGLARPREWDTVVTVEADDLPGDAVRFVATDDGTLIVDEDVPDGALQPLADAVETQLNAPYRAEATRRGERLWAVGATKIRLERISDEIGGDSVELAVQEGGDRTVLVDGASTFGSVPALEALAEGMRAYVIRADRVDDDLWEVRVLPL
jgi:hypothetical protein